MQKIAIILLNNKGIETARKIKTRYEDAVIWGLAGRVIGADQEFDETGNHLRGLYQNGVTIIGLCATGILIRALSPVLSSKQSEPPLLAISDDGALVIPLLGGLTGANEMAREISRLTKGIPAITASGARHFGVQLEAPPGQYALANKGDAKKFTSDLLSGSKIILEGSCAWLEDSQLPFAENGDRLIRLTIKDETPPENGLLYHPKLLMVEITDKETTAEDITLGCKSLGYSPLAIAALITSDNGPVNAAKTIGKNLSIPVRLVDNFADLKIAKNNRLAKGQLQNASSLSIIELQAPPELKYLGKSIGKVTVLGLGPGKSDWLTPEVKSALEQAEILVGYQTYIDMVPVREGQQRLPSDNRVELERAREALDLALKGRHVAVVSSGDPGIFAMASAVIEALDKDPVRWQTIDFEVLPGLSAMQGAASLAGAPLGHDFAVISLSDIRKPFETIEQRLVAAAISDMVIAIYNPASRTRRKQLKEMKQILLEQKESDTPVLLAKNIGREGQELHYSTLAGFDPDLVDMRTLLIIGSSKTRLINGPNGTKLLYTPRSYN